MLMFRVRPQILFHEPDQAYSQGAGPSEMTNIVEDVLEGWRRGTRGPLPQITPLQLLNALVTIDREGPIGRRALAHSLRVKDGVVRGLLERLAESKIAMAAETGVQLSPNGRKSLRKFLRQLSVKKIARLGGSGLIGSSQGVGVLLGGAYRKGMTGVAARDEAIKAGAGGSITIAVFGKKLVIPPDNKNIADLDPKEDARLRSEFNPSDKDLIIIGFGSDLAIAQAGALAAVMSLQQN